MAVEQPCINTALHDGLYEPVKIPPPGTHVVIVPCNACIKEVYLTHECVVLLHNVWPADLIKCLV